MAISTMQQPRQQYGLGKLVKKAFKGVKKVFKSPLGKAALIGGLGSYGLGMGPLGGIKGAGFKSLVKRFPELSSDDFVSVDDILNICSERSLDKPLKMYGNTQKQQNYQ